MSSMPLRVFGFLALAMLLAGCATHNQPSKAPSDQAKWMCAGYGFAPGTDPFKQCLNEVDRAIERHIISSRARVNCTPMGKQTVCQ